MKVQESARVDVGVSKFDIREPLRVEMPPYPKVTEADIDAQVFSSMLTVTQGSVTQGVKDIDDMWVQENYPGITSVEQLRSIMKQELEKGNHYAYLNLTYARCADALVAGLKEEVSAEDIDKNKDEIRRRKEELMHGSGISLPQYLRDENLSESEYEQRILEETTYEIALTQALDAYVAQKEIEVTLSDLGEYLSVDDSDAFLQELKETDKQEEAQCMAARVKAMRELIEKAEITYSA